MPVMTKGDKKVLFLHIPKTGGTTVENVFYRNGWDVSLTGYNGDYVDHIESGGNRSYSLTHLPVETLDKLLDGEKFDEIFTVVRHPVDRMVSEYNFRIEDRARLGEFDEWFEWAIAQYEKDPWFNDNHMRPQEDYINYLVNWVKLEDGMESLFAKLSESLEEPVIFRNERSNPSMKVMKVENVSPEMRKRIEDYYEGDMRTFSYKGGLQEPG